MNQKALKLDYQDDYDKSLDSLMDIQILSEFTVSPLVGHAYFYLSEMKRKADLLKLGQLEHLTSIQAILENKLIEIFNIHFNESGRFKGYSLIKSTKNIDLKKWNHLFDNIPEILSLTTFFNYHGMVEVTIDEDRLEVSGHILVDENIEKNRKFIYVITRKLLRAKIIQTFTLEKSERAGLFKLVLKSDISWSENLVYQVPFKISTNKNYVVGFSNVLYGYRKRADEVTKLSKHNIIEIDNMLNVSHRYDILDLKAIEFNNKELLHFSFLFRPVSIILPVKGSLVTDTYSKILEDENKRNQNVSNHFRSIDFFSLFNL